MTNNERQKIWEKFVDKIMLDQKSFSIYGISESPASYNGYFFTFLLKIIVHLDKELAIKLELENHLHEFYCYLDKIDIEVDEGCFSSERTKIGFKIFLNMYFTVLNGFSLTKEVLQECLMSIKGKTIVLNEEKIAVFVENNLKFVHQSYLDLKKDRTYFNNGIAKIIKNENTSLDALHSLRLQIASLVIENPSSVDVKNLKMLSDVAIEKRVYEDIIREKVVSHQKEETANQSSLEIQDNKNEKQNHEKLGMFFESTAKYKAVMEILVNKKYIFPNTYIWLDESKSNKSFLASLLKNLHGKKFYKKNIRPSNKQICVICKNTFGIDVGIDTVKRAKSTDFNFNFIPYSSTLNNTQSTQTTLE